MPRKDIDQILQERAALAEKTENTIAHRELAPATHDKYDHAVETWILWRLSRGEPGDTERMKEEPMPTPQTMKLFAENYIVTRKKDLPSTETVCGHFINFTSFWERTTSKEIPMEVKKDVLNHLTFHLKWGRESGKIRRWVTIDPEFLKGCRFQDNIKVRPRSWFREHDILGFNFVFWVIVHGIADGAFKGISTIEELLAIRPPEGRESWTLRWRQEVQNVPFFRMVNSEGPKQDKALTFSSLRHNNTSLARRNGYKNTLRVHGIRGAVANRIDARGSEATRGQALDHQNPDTYLKYQSTIKALDVQALFWDLEQDFECRDMEQSMAHHRDSNAPVYLNAAAREEFLQCDKVVAIDAKIAILTEQINRRPEDHSQLTAERNKLHIQKANLREAYRSSFISKWWDASYDEYVAGNELKERDRTCLFDILRKYLPERARLRDNLFKEASLDSDTGKQCLHDMVSLCVGTESVVYYPGLRPENDKCPYCFKDILRSSDAQVWPLDPSLHARCSRIVPFLSGDNSKVPDERFQQWLTKATLMHHINVHLDQMSSETNFRCPHPLCGERDYGKKNNLRYHLFDGHSIEEPRPNCIALKRKMGKQLESEDNEDQKRKSRKL
ncbi:uncharacterized protein N7477_004959 [Penicillium maclennaniae]|uniref:uncharacterized protein n=1 Tax=Penicillium maclennaniae TaxID=1343394 RepID=UPI00254120FF|nr:uncharacterized protein N7477_004959 [Penicillium maclennaniae]KAJ5675025.1 hypothetical protein N7477_004959 [Penicillium maclennaniae]